MKEFIVAANWKLNKGPKEASEFCDHLQSTLSDAEIGHVVVFPSAISLPAACATSVSVGIQNVYFELKGAFTGENSLEVAKQIGCKWVLIGHSERRQLFGETDELLAKKLLAAQKVGLRPMLCIGETIEQRNQGDTLKVLKTQLSILSQMTSHEELAIAYEPVWAIGTGVVASVEQVSETHTEIRKILHEMGVSPLPPILYGGSVKPANVADLGQIEDVNGFLVGGASLDIDSFTQVVRGAGRIPN